MAAFSNASRPRLPGVAPCAAAALLLCLTACTVGPDYVAPRPDTPESFGGLERTAQTANPSVAQAAEPDPNWWRAFKDPVLDSLIQRAIAGNLSLRQAVLRIAGAREQVVQARGAGLPAVNFQGSAKRQQLGVEGMLDSAHVRDRIQQSGSTEVSSVVDRLTDPVNLYQLGFDASWELDLFGRVRRSVEAADAQTLESVEQRNDALVSLEAEVARAYLQLRGAQTVADTMRTQIRIAEDSLQLTEDRRRNGLAPQTDVENARAQLGGLRAQLPQYESQARQAMNGLAVLLGQPPGALDAELSTPAPMPALPAAVPIGVPSSLARRRPDVRRAEASLHAATANIGVSVAQLFPDVSLTGQFGLRNTQLDYLTRWGSHFYSFGPSVSLPIFQGGRLVSNVRLSRAQQASAALDYRQTVLTALQDVENALVAYRTDQERVDGLDQTAASLQNSYDLASDSYCKGLISFIEVLDAQRQLAQARQQATQARVQTSTDLVTLYKALGGGWEPYTSVQLPTYKVFGPAETPQSAAPAADASSPGAAAAHERNSNGHRGEPAGSPLAS